MYEKLGVQPDAVFHGPTNMRFVLCDEYLAQGYLCQPDPDVPMQLYRIVSVTDGEVKVETLEK